MLLENGLPPLVLAEYLVAEPPMLRDERARRDVDALLRQFRAGTLGGGVFFDPATTSRCTVRPPRWTTTPSGRSRTACWPPASSRSRR